MKTEDYSPSEELWNIITHALGFFASIFALVLLSIKANATHSYSYIIFGCSLTILYAASTLYHSTKENKKRRILKIIDHAAIYLLISGTATPIIIIGIKENDRSLLFVSIMWAIAIIGIIFKLFFTGKFKIASTLSYIIQGLIIVWALNPIWNDLPQKLVLFIILGGCSYILGAILYLIQKIPFNHVIFHTMCLLGSLFHFVGIYFYL